MSFQTVLKFRKATEIALVLVCHFVFSPNLAQGDVVSRISASANNSGYEVSPPFDSCGNRICEVQSGGSPVIGVGIEGSIDTPAQNAFASAFGSYSATDNHSFSHPHTRLSVSNRGGHGKFGHIRAESRIFDRVVMEAKAIDDLFGFELSRIEFKLYDHGALYSPPLRRWYQGGHGMNYSRSLNVGSVYGLDSNTSFSFVDNPSNRNFSAGVNYGDGLLGVDNSDTVVFTFVNTPFFSREVPGLRGLRFDFDYRTSVQDGYTTFGLDPATTAYGNFENTSGLESISVYDTNGTDLTHLFSFRTNSGLNLFSGSSVPEPSSLCLVGILATGFFLRRRKQF